MNGEMTAHERVMIARNPQRPGIRDYIDALFPHFFELQGKALAEQRFHKFRRMSAFERAQQPAARQEKET